MRTIGLFIALLVIFAFVSREAKVTLQIALAIAFTLVLFVFLIIEISSVYKSEEEELEEGALEGEIAGDPDSPEEAEAIVVEAEGEEGGS